MSEISTVHLGQFTDEHANEIAGKLEERGIVWWYKQPGYLSRVWERGTRLFVDAKRLDEARAIAAAVLSPSPLDEPAAPSRHDGQ